MVRRTPFLLVISIVGASIGCSAHAAKVAPAVTPAAPATGAQTAAPATDVQPQPAPDPIATLIATSESHFKSGQRELDLGHADAARQQFDDAIGVLMESPYGGRTEPRIREQFDRLVERISNYEVQALADGDGFTEKKSEPASIDELLALSATFATPPPASPEIAEAVHTDPEIVAHDIPIPLNDRVLSFVGLFQGRLHDFLQEGMQRGSQYLPMIQDVFRAEGLPLDLAYIPLVESAFKPNALSRASAKGVWQFMRGTGIENGLRHDWYIDERSDPEKATAAAAKYLGTLAKMFDGDWHLAMASYNGGPGRIQRAMKRGHTDDFWKLAESARLLPRETRDYVPMILAAIIIAKNPAQYGFDFTSAPPLEYETVTLPEPVDLRRVAEWAGATIDDLQALNPELRRWTTPVRDTAYDLKVPVGTSATVNDRLKEMLGSDGVDLASLRWYTVKKGETIRTIARKLKVARADLADANYLKAASKLRTGQRLIVPREPAVLMAAQTNRAEPAGEVDGESGEPVATVARATSGTRGEKVTYRVKRGDTLFSIARLFSTSVASIKSWNGIPGSQIQAGDRLTIYPNRSR